MISATTITLDLRAYYRRSFCVRRRRLAEKIFLVHLARIFEIDEVSNTVWLHCDGSKNALQIARRVSDAFPDINKGEVGALALYNLQFFLDRELVKVLPTSEEGL